MIQFGKTSIAPTAYRYQGELARVVSSSMQAGLKTDRREQSLRQISDRIDAFAESLDVLDDVAGASVDEQPLSVVQWCADTLKPAMENLREHVDALETMIDEGMWPLASYRNLLFTR